MNHHTSDPVCPLCEEKLAMAYQPLADWFRSRVKTRFKDAHVSWSFRNKQEQDACVADGASKLLWPKSAHNNSVPIDYKQTFSIYIFGPNSKPCALALDLFQINAAFPNGCWDPKFYYDLNDLNHQNGSPILSGVEWRKFGDAGHFQWDGPINT